MTDRKMNFWEFLDRNIEGVGFFALLILLAVFEFIGVL